MKHRSTYSAASQKLNPTVTEQNEPIPGKTMIPNNAGGYGFEITPWEQLERFLIVGSESGNYYVNKLDMTLDNAKNVSVCLNLSGKQTVDTIVSISQSGRAAKNEPALFALAMCAAANNLSTRTYALQSLSKIARIGTHLFAFIEYVNNLRGWSCSLRTAVSNWYTECDSDRLQLQLTKYQSRNGWAHRDVLRLAHPHPQTEAQRLAFLWSVDLLSKYKDKSSKHFNMELYTKTLADLHNVLPLIGAYEDIKVETDETRILSLIRDHKMPLELVPTEKRTKDVYNEVLPNLGITALIRQLATLTKEGVLGEVGSDNTKYVIQQLHDADLLKKGRVHPIQLLLALATYKAGKSFRGSATWKPIDRITAALEDAFYLSFGNVTPTNKRIMYGLDISGSMTWTNVLGSEQLMACEVTAAMSMVLARIEPDHMIMGFSHEFRTLGITSNDSLSEVLDKVTKQAFGGTDVSLPMLYASKKKLPIDAFVVYTDNETWCGSIHPIQALKQYQQQMGIPAKLISVATSATNITIAEESPFTMNVVGFDAAAPHIINDFISNKKCNCLLLGW